MEPVVAQGFTVDVAQRAAHPHAAMLFYDYRLSPETQKLLASLHYFSASAKVASPYPDLKLHVIDPELSIDNFAKWNKAFDDTVPKQVR